MNLILTQLTNDLVLALNRLPKRLLEIKEQSKILNEMENSKRKIKLRKESKPKIKIKRMKTRYEKTRL